MPLHKRETMRDILNGTETCVMALCLCSVWQVPTVLPFIAW